MLIKRLLIANRGEIACRIMRTAKRLGIHCIAIYSDADANSLHVNMADSAYRVGGELSKESYLNIPAIIDIAKKHHADAIHPGYGFLAENAAFAEHCRKENICFIGPKSDVIRIMGNKDEAKSMMAHAKIPVVPGYHGADQATETLKKQAEKIGFPLLIKAAAGGGGKGMRIVHEKKELEHAIIGAKREAKSSFNDEKLILEKYISPVRHIEVQLLGDEFGNVVHLFTRDCSIQRRHQKIVEEATAPNLTKKVADNIAHTAIQVAKTISYSNAGTVEFLLDEKNNFYFMEMNTRLQVEHPVTEMVTAMDLVEWQLKVASGEKLSFSQQDISQTGHSIEVRIYAEDPSNEFLPSTGTLAYLKFPEIDENTRVETGVKSGDSISRFYDPMIAKLVVHGDHRLQAIARLQQALNQTHIVGVKNNVSFLQQIISLPTFVNAELSTSFLKNNEEVLKTLPDVSFETIALAIAQQWFKTTSRRPKKHDSPWQVKDHFRLNLPRQRTFHFEIGHQKFDIFVTFHHDHLQFLWHGTFYTFQLEKLSNTEFRVNIEHHLVQQGTVIEHQKQLFIFTEKQQAQITLFDPLSSFDLQQENAQNLRAPMPGTVIAVMTKEGAMVKQGDQLVVIEAMKMEHTIRAPRSGVIKAIHCRVGETVEEGVELFDFKDE